MPILHKFLNYNGWNNAFYTQDSILHTPYDPEVIIIGSFNHGWQWNNADFYYGRGMYLWTIMANLFQHNSSLLTARRTAKNSIPTLQDIFNICISARFCFADIVRGTKPHVSTSIRGNSVRVNRQFTWRGYEDKSLEYMAAQNWLDDNVSSIITYIASKPSIKQIYFTFKSGTWLAKKARLIQNAFPQIPCLALFSPTGNGFGKNLSAPFNKRAWSICHCWIWNGFHHIGVPVTKPGYGHLNHAWLTRRGIDINMF